MRRFQGTYTAMLTPFSESGDGIDEVVLRQAIDHQIMGGIHGVVVAGSFGEFTALSEVERERLVSVTLDHVAGRIPVIVGVSAYTTQQTVALARHAEHAGADGVMALPLGFWKLSLDEAKRHFAAVSDAVSVPIMIYNNPPKTAGVDLSAEFLGELCEMANIQYVKETSYDVHRVQEIIALLGDRLTVFTGDDGGALPAFCLGARGWVAGTSNFLPAVCAEVFTAFSSGDMPKATRAHYQVVAIRKELGTLGPSIGVARAATEAVGVPIGPPRAPLLSLSAPQRQRVQEILQQAGLSGELQVR